MSTIQDIEAAIDALPPEKFAELAQWVSAKRAREVDAAFERAILDGGFDRIAEEAAAEISGGKTIPLDEFLGHP